MITFSSLDFNLDKIERISGLNFEKTENRYRIYGLKQEDENPPLKIELNKIFFDKIPKLKSFFKKRGIGVEFKEEKYSETIEIGLRKDLRQQPNLSAAIVSTIIYTFEGKFNLKSSKLGIPKFN